MAKKTTSPKKKAAPVKKQKAAPVKKIKVEPAANLPVEKKSEEIKTVSPSDILEHLHKSNEVMKAIRSQFGYSGYSNPNYVNLDREIKNNETFFESLK